MLKLTDNEQHNSFLSIKADKTSFRFYSSTSKPTQLSWLK